MVGVLPARSAAAVLTMNGDTEILFLRNHSMNVIVRTGLRIAVIMLVIAAVTGTATAGAVTVPNYSFQANVGGDGG